jgi:hypothetical protein
MIRVDFCAMIGILLWILCMQIAGHGLTPAAPDLANPGAFRRLNA